MTASAAPSRDAEQARLARTCIASALEFAAADWPKELFDALASPRSAWPTGGHAAIADWVLATKRSGLAPTLAKLTTSLPGHWQEANELLNDALPLGLAAIEAKTFVDGVRGAQAATQLSLLAQRLSEDPAKAEKFLSVAIPELQSLAASFHAGPQLTILSPDEILALKCDPNENLIGSRLLTKRGQLLIAGAGGIGKSRLALQLAVCVITGQPLFGLRTFAPGSRWLVLQAENDPTRQKADLEALRRFAGDQWPDVNECLRLHALVSETDGFLSLDDPACVARIRAALDTFRPDVVVIDSLYNFGIGDLNTDRDMRLTLTDLGRVMRHRNPNRALVVLHHAGTGRAGAAKLSGFDRASFSRNSKIVHSWARGVINVAPVSEGDNETLAVACGKSNNGPEFAPFAIRLNRDSMLYEPAPDVDIKGAIATAAGADKGPAVTPDIVADLCHGKTKPQLVKRIMEQTGVAKSRAYLAVAEAESSRKVRFDKDSETYRDRRVQP